MSMLRRCVQLVLLAAVMMVPMSHGPASAYELCLGFAVQGISEDVPCIHIADLPPPGGGGIKIIGGDA
jgi:hypothetical protein